MKSMSRSPWICPVPIHPQVVRGRRGRRTATFWMTPYMGRTRCPRSHPVLMHPQTVRDHPARTTMCGIAVYMGCMSSLKIRSLPIYRQAVRYYRERRVVIFRVRPYMEGRSKGFRISSVPTYRQTVRGCRGRRTAVFLMMYTGRTRSLRICPALIQTQVVRECRVRKAQAFWMMAHMGEIRKGIKFGLVPVF